MESNDSPEIPDRGETSDIPGLPSGGKEERRQGREKEVGRQQQGMDKPGDRSCPREQWRTEKYGGNLLRSHLWSPNNPHSYGIGEEGEEATKLQWTRILKQFEVYDSDTPVTLNQYTVIKPGINW